MSSHFCEVKNQSQNNSLLMQQEQGWLRYIRLAAKKKKW